MRILTLLILTTGLAIGAGAPVFETPDAKDLLQGAHALKKGYVDDAVSNFESAARYGNKDAQRTLGMMYIQGLGVAMNWPLGYAWLRLAATHGDAEAVSARDQVHAQLKPEELADATRYVAELDAEFGDLAAVARREEWVRKQKREITGSRTGSSAGVRIQVADATGYTWQVSGARYFELLEGDYVLEFRQRMGEVEIGELRVVDEN